MKYDMVLHVIPFQNVSCLVDGDQTGGKNDLIITLFRFVVTAAHCLIDQLELVLLGVRKGL